MTRQAAMAMGEKRYISRTACSRCGSSERYVANRHCIPCLRARKDSWDAAHPEHMRLKGNLLSRLSYQRHKAKKLLYSKEYTARKKPERRAFIDSLKAVPCKDCGVQYPPCAMDFDHVNGKTINVGLMLGWKKESILAEAAKCEVVCANCHRLRTHARGYAKLF